MEDQFFFKETYRVRAYEIDRFKRMTVPALVRLMHETAMQQVVDLKMSVWDLEPHHISWVLIRMNFKIHRLPNIGEYISVQTNPSGFEKVFTYRDYIVFDAEGERIASASSTWILMDTIKRKMTRIPEFIRSFHIPDTFVPQKRALAKLPPFTRVDKALNFRVYWFDLDFNLHLNNMYYLQWMLESTPHETLNNKQLVEVNIIYKLETGYDEQLISQTQQKEDNTTFAHRIIRKKDGAEIAQCETIWK